METKKILNPTILLSIFIIVYLIIGLFITPDFGLNWDYWPEQDHSLYTLSYIINYDFSQPTEFDAPYDLNYYGPALITPIQYINIKLQSIWPALKTAEVFYFFHFVSFLVGIVFFYMLAKRFFNQWTAFVVTLLYATQPLFFGHAFINYKDTPFMAFFIASISTGFIMVDHISKNNLEDKRRRLAKILYPLISPRVILAGIMVGVTTSIRVLGPAAAGMVIIYLLIRERAKSLNSIAAYSIWGILTTFLTWPYLWTAKFAGFIKSLNVMADFHWRGLVLFNGVNYQRGTLPRVYLPSLMTLQFTEPVILLLIVGIAAIILNTKKNTNKFYEILLVGAWFLIPFSLVIIVNPIMYNNFRQFLFITPPLILYAGFGLEFLMNKINQLKGKVLLAILVLLPGVISLFYLHPYQYIYYNQFIGGINGVSRKYETDYWITSFKEGMGYINEIAEPNSQILVWGPIRFAKFYARDDLTLLDQRGIGDNPIESYDYALLHTRLNFDLRNAPNAEIIYIVQVGEAPLAVIKKLKP